MATRGGGVGSSARGGGSGADSGGTEGDGVRGGRVGCDEADRVWGITASSAGTATDEVGGNWAPPPEPLRTTLNTAGEKVTG